MKYANSVHGVANKIDVPGDRPVPGGTGIKHFTGNDRADFDASMSLVDFLCREKIGLDFPKPGSGNSGSDRDWEK